MTHDELSREYIKQYYGLDVEIGQRVLVDGRPGMIVGFNGAYLRVLFDGWSHVVNCHPRWRVIYLCGKDR